MQVKLRFPNGSNHRGRFWKGTTRSALIWLACSSEWAQQVRPAGVSLSMGHPPELLSTEGELTEDFANAMIIVKEVRAEDLPIDSNVESQEADVQPTENENLLPVWKNLRNKTVQQHHKIQCVHLPPQIP